MDQALKTFQLGGGSRVTIGDTVLREYILADSGFAPNNYTVTPFDHRGARANLTAQQVEYNRRISRVRVLVECSIG